MTGSILRKFHAAFYKHPVKTSQDAIILKCCQAVPISRKRPRTLRLDPAYGIQTPARASKQYTIKYHIKVNKQSLTVCQKKFLAATCLKKGQVSNLVQKSFVSGEFPLEKRGGDRKTSIHAFIQKLHCSEPHYCRSQTTIRKYLPSDLNIRKLYCRVVKILSYDCQKNMNLPKVPDQSCYYSRQLFLFNFTIVEGTSKAPLNRSNVFANVWTENTYSKISNTIASAIYNHLNKTDLANITTIRLLTDVCGGQNKNSTMITMCCKWLLEHPSIKRVELVFPVTGDSYLPADRVFGNSEKVFRKMDTIITHKQYLDVICQQATIVKVGEDFTVYDFKKETEKKLKPPERWKVHFAQCKRFSIKRSKRIGNVLVQSERFYKTQTGKYENVCRKDKIMSMIAPDVIRPTYL